MRDRWDELDEMEESQRGGGFKNILKLLVALVVGGVALFVLYTYLTENEDQTNNDDVTVTATPKVEASPTVEVEATAEPTAKPTNTPAPTKTPLDLSNVTVQVLNGSGTAGAANGLSSFLKNGGVGATTTGNASNFSYTDLTLKISPDQENSTELVELLKSFHSKVVIEEDSSLVENSFIVILGKF